VVLLKDPTRAAIAKAARESRDSEPNPWRNRAEIIAAIIARPSVRNWFMRQIPVRSSVRHQNTGNFRVTE
jgi:hypothetical protein